MNQLKVLDSSPPKSKEKGRRPPGNRQRLARKLVASVNAMGIFQWSAVLMEEHHYARVAQLTVFSAAFGVNPRVCHCEMRCCVA